MNTFFKLMVKLKKKIKKKIEKAVFLHKPPIILQTF